METTEKEGLEIIDLTEGQDDCKVGRDEKSKLVVERSRGVAEKTGKAGDKTGTGLEGPDRASVSTFLEPGMWIISLVNSEI